MPFRRAIPLDMARASTDRRALVQTAAGTIAAIVAGEPRRDVPEVVLVHGITDTADTWRAVHGSLAADTRVHAVDLPGHGLSDFPDEPLTVAAMADAVSAYLDAAGVSSAVVVGNSLGGGVTLGLCARDADRVRAAVTLGSIGMPCPIPFPLTLLRHRPFGEAMAWAVTRPLQRLLVRESYAPGFRPDPEDVRNYFLAWRVAGRGAGIRSLMRVLDVAEPRAWLASIAIPVDVVHGELDRLIPTRVARELAEALPNGRLTILDGIGHEPHQERPEQTIELVRAALRGT